MTTDGFLLPNAELERRGLMQRKGFPESFDQARLLRFVADVKAGKANVEAPVYSHNSYDIVPGEKIVVDRPDILIVEGLNVLQPAKLPRHGEAVPFVSDFSTSRFISTPARRSSRNGTSRDSCASGRRPSATRTPIFTAIPS